MSSAKSCPQTPVRSPKCITLLQSVLQHDLYLSLEINTPCTFGPIKCYPIDDDFNQFTVIKENAVEIGWSRVRADPAAKPDAGYSILLRFAVVGLDEDAKTVEMRYDEDCASVEFLWGRPIESIGVPYLLVIQTVVKMVEYEVMPGPVKESNRRRIDKIKALCAITNDRLSNLCCLLKLPSIEDLFTGRHDDAFDQAKFDMISRAALFVDDFLRYFRAKEEGRLEKSDFGTINHRLYAVFKHRDLLKMLLQAIQYGVDFIQELAADCAIDKMGEDKDYAADVIVPAAHFQLEELFGKAADLFVRNWQELTGSEKWKHVTEEQNLTALYVIHLIHTRLRIKELYNP